MTDRTSHSKVHEVADGNQYVPVASPQLLLTEVLERLANLEEEYRNFREEVALERAHDRKRIANLEDLVEREAHDAALARQRISKLETPALREETAAAHLDRLSSEMRRLSIRQTTTKDAARLLGVSKRHISRLEPLLAADHRFQIVHDPHHKQRHLIRLV
jgi:hypothetical protein